jgi:hypothetical protein
MHPVRPLLLAGLASVAVAGFAGLAHAGDPGFKTMTVQLPGGGIEQIEYTGDVAPQVILSPASSVDADAAPMAVGLPLGASDPFAALEQISAQMDQQAAAMIDAVNAMAAGAEEPGAMVPASFGQMPPGSAGYSYIASMTGGTGGACVQSLEITAMANGQPPRVVSHASGDCGGQPSLDAPTLGVPGGAGPAGAVPAALPAAPAPVQQPQLIRVKYLVPKPGVSSSQT